MLAEVLDMDGAETIDRSEGDVISSMLIAIWGNSGHFFVPKIEFQQSGSYLLCYSLVAPKHASEEISGRVKAVDSGVKMPAEETKTLNLMLSQLSTGRRSIWSLANDRALLKAVECCEKGPGGCYDWVAISKNITSKTATQCKGRLKEMKRRLKGMKLHAQAANAKSTFTNCKKQKVPKPQKYETLSASNSKIYKYLSKHDMQFVSETLEFHVMVVPSPHESPCQSDDMLELEEISDTSHLDAPSVESVSSVTPSSAPNAPDFCHVPKSNLLFVDQPPAVLKKLAYIHLTIH